MLASIRPQDYDAHLQLRPSIVLSKEAIMSTSPKRQPSALDPVKLDPDHYKVEFENDRVRVLRVNYGPRERSVMHSHPDGIGLFLTSQHSRFTFTTGRSTENHFKAGEVKWLPEGTHLPENLGDQSIELVLVELKT
jgi:quercetin dioxygenase-like cupin family protein